MQLSRTTRESLPAPVYDLAYRLGALARPEAATVRFSQEGRMRESAGRRWMRFRASQTVWIDRCAFDWRARAGLAGWIGIRDRLIGGVGRLEVKALGLLPLARISRSVALTRGETIRYLAELPLAPEAIVRNPSLHWTAHGPGKLKVTALAEGAPVEVMFSLDGEGRIAEALAESRPRAVPDGFVETPWRGRFADYRQQDGLWLPSMGRVCWITDGRPEMVWEGRGFRRLPPAA